MHFGYNCKHYLPWFEKCKLMVEKNRNQKDLMETKWLSVREALIYSSLLNMDLVNLVKKKKVKIKKEDKKPIRLGFFTAWDYDECPLAHCGGQCLYFERHDGNKISCVSDLADQRLGHPNSPKIPTDDEIKLLKNALVPFAQEKTIEDTGLLF
jgi:hypothetical protein